MKRSSKSFGATLASALVLACATSACADYSNYRTGGSGSAATRSDAPTCKAVAAPYGRVFGAILAKKNPKPDAISLVEASVIASCESEKWPASALTCLSAAKTGNEMDACISALPAADQQKMEDAALAKLK